MAVSCKITPCLWFDNEGEEAARFYAGIFPNSRVGKIARYGEAGREIHDRPPGSVMTVAFELDGQPFMALNGGPIFTFNEAISLQVLCETQQEVDDYWRKLTAGGDPNAQQCGWLKDRYGVSWQIIPKVLSEMVGRPDDPRSQRAMEALLKMQKIDIPQLEAAYAGQGAG